MYNDQQAGFGQVLHVQNVRRNLQDKTRVKCPRSLAGDNNARIEVLVQEVTLY